MKRNFYSLLSFVFLLAGVCGITSANAQGGVYFRENFATGTGPTSDPTNSTTVSDYTDANGLIWKFYGLWLTNGTSCLDVPGSTGGANRHIRSTSNSGLVDTAYTILPDVWAGIYSVNIQRSRASRRLTFWINNNNTTDPTDGGWTLANVTVKNANSPAVLCQDTVVMINSATARRLMIKFEKAGNNDVDSIALTSVGPLPTRFGSFYVQQKNDEVVANWDAYNETQLRGYYLQKSTDGSSFADVNFVTAKNNMVADYTTTDKIKGATTLYYRIKSVDLDGKAGYGPVARISVNRQGFDGVVVKNPVRGNTLELQLNGMEPGTYQVSLNGISGTKFATKAVQVQSSTVTVSMELPSSISKGIQILTVTGGKFRHAEKVMVE